MRVRAGESFMVAVERERRRRRQLFVSAPKEGITAGASTSTGVPNESKGSGEPMPMRRRQRGCRLDELVFPQESTSSSSCGPPTPTPPPQMRTEGAGVSVRKKSKVSCSYGPATPPPRMQTDGAGIPNKSKGSGSCGPEIPPPAMRTKGAAVSQNSKGSGSCGLAMPPPGVPTEGAGVPVPKKWKVSGSCGLGMPPPGMPTEGASVFRNNKGSGSCGPAMPPPGMRMEGASVSQNNKGSGSCGPAMRPPQLRAVGAGLSQKSKGPGSCGPEMPPPGVQTEGAGIPQKSMRPGSCRLEMPPPGVQTEGASVPEKGMGSGSYGPAMPPSRMQPELELTVVDTDALDCGVCFLPLKAPIFQCNNGHVVCSLCHDKLKATGKCHVCGVTTDGNSRCHAMERLAESIRFLCPNATYGCTARLAYHDREGHWLKCPHSPYCCPDKACGFIGPMELLLDHFAYVHGWPSFTTAPASGHFNVSLHDGLNFLCAVDQASSSPGILFVLNVVRRPLGHAISMLCMDTRAANNVQGQFPKEPIECELTYSRYVSSKSRSISDQLTAHYQRCKFRVPLTDLSNGLPSTDGCFQFVVPNFALGEENKETIPSKAEFSSARSICVSQLS